MAIAVSDEVYDGRRAWALHPQVSLRPESFGALAYHFGTRRLSFLKSPELRAVVERLAETGCGDEALVEVGVPEAEWPRYHLALATLARTGMIVRRDPS